ncbi:ATP-dependent DNA helicase [Alkalihalobacillus sp. CinArs1]|uniref:ATP-dependent DNA helicase n=1 Tax=Alkalihalobacillus sp. CinArs1 TaxID=2995314 RepID=UPI0022DD8FA4|nr:ATP-dependent DNA helicase [Alkalihalobacillus sp. CinArs1]
MHESIKVSVRPLVEYAFRSGSIDARFRTATTMHEGTKLHQYVQKQYGEQDQKEVPFEMEFEYDDLLFYIEGRCDGLLKRNDSYVVDEIKSTSLPLEEINENSYAVHWAQAKCYAYMAMMKYDQATISVQLTYIQSETKEVRTFTNSYSLEDLSHFISEVIQRYTPFARWKVDHHHRLIDSSRSLTFPFETYREGQRKFAGSVYKTVQEGATLFASAPTGIGKTMSTLFPTIKAIGEGHGQKIFYLTAKTITRETAQEAFKMMEDKGLIATSVTITAKDKVCFKEKTICQKDYCEYADGYYDRINEGLLDLLRNETRITREVLEGYAHKHRLCPFELSLDAAYVADAVICDYNYIFDPRVSLKRLIEEQKKQTTVLIDEAHNLVDRARGMFSAELHKSAFLQLKRSYRSTNQEISNAASSINKLFIDYKKSAQSGYVVQTDVDEELLVHLDTFVSVCEKELLLQGNDEELLDVYFTCQNFIRIAKLYDHHFFTLVQAGKSEASMKLFCFDPSNQLSRMRNGFRSTVFFSATFSPLSYYQNMLGWEDDDYQVTIPSPFPEENMSVYIAPLSTKYREREETLEPLIDLLENVVTKRKGNYLFFFSSYGYMERVYEAYTDREIDTDTILQHQNMTEEEREQYLETFTSGRSKSLAGFAVLGGIFSEGIDLKGDRLTGVVVVGVGLPNFDTERKLMKERFDLDGKNGFEYTYVYPGMNRVQQAGGRLIRSETDKGILVLIDSRYVEKRYQQLLPFEWRNFDLLTPEKKIQ